MCETARSRHSFEVFFVDEPHSDLGFTYVCNTMNVHDLITHQEIYWPQVVRQPMPSVIAR